ncbi:MAG TPA: hypothetical protein VJT73_03515, partial [Polyangiaceae bacterium]|nr:hypothetical protein [Polyangiaceae bacterium]
TFTGTRIQRHALDFGRAERDAASLRAQVLDAFESEGQIFAARVKVRDGTPYTRQSSEITAV